jgi:hypothetical protein
MWRTLAEVVALGFAAWFAWQTYREWLSRNKPNRALGRRNKAAVVMKDTENPEGRLSEKRLSIPRPSEGGTGEALLLAVFAFLIVCATVKFLLSDSNPEIALGAMMPTLGACPPRENMAIGYRAIQRIHDFPLYANGATLCPDCRKFGLQIRY